MNLADAARSKCVDYCKFSNTAEFRLSLLNREGSFAPEASPMESCRPAIIVSFGVTVHWRPRGTPEGEPKHQESIPWQSLVGAPLFGPPRFETPRSAPRKRGSGGSDML